jgi:hypothetical protein
VSVVVKVPFGFAALLGWMGLAFGGHASPSVKDELDSAGPIRELTGQALYDGERLATPMQIAAVGDRIALTDGSAATPIHVLDAEGRYLAGLGREGEGPGEFQWPRTLEPAADGRGFWVFDMGLSRLTLVEPERWGVTPSSERLTLSLRGPAFVTSVIRGAGGGLLAAGFFGEGRLGHYAPDGRYAGASGPLPSSAIEAPPEVLQHAYRGILKADPAGDRLVLANRHAGFLEIYSAGGELERRIEGPYPFEPAFEVTAGENGPSLATGSDLRFGYIDVATTPDRIYALFSGRTRAGHPEDASYARYVHVFDWQGGLLAVLHLDADAAAIAVDPGRERLLAVRHLPTPAVLSYSLDPGVVPTGGAPGAD